MLVGYTLTTQESKPSRKSWCTISIFFTSSGILLQKASYNAHSSFLQEHAISASTIAAGVPLPTVTIAQSAIPCSVLTSWEHINEIAHAIHAWNALKSMAGTLCPAASAMMRRKAEVNTWLWKWLQFSLTSAGDFNHSKLQKNILNFTKVISRL